MKKSIKCGITAAVVAVASFAASQSYGSYGTQDNSLLMQNIEALANEKGEGGDNTGEGGAITMQYCTDGEPVIVSLSTKPKCASGTSMSVTVPTTPSGTIYPCGSTYVACGPLSKIGYCYKSK